jgi:hypothetical protein
MMGLAVGVVNGASGRRVVEWSHKLRKARPLRLVKGNQARIVALCATPSLSLTKS